MLWFALCNVDLCFCGVAPLGHGYRDDENKPTPLFNDIKNKWLTKPTHPFIYKPTHPFFEVLQRVLCELIAK